jgi:hypothetical protein
MASNPTNATRNTGFTNTSTQNSSTVGSNAIQQFVFPVIIVLVLYCMFMFLEIMYKYINRLSVNRVELLPNTSTSDNTKTISQNPLLTDKTLIQLSDNERTGIEFTYSFYLFVNPSSFTQDDGLLHIFHKGYASQFPLLGPGVYMRSNKNTLRVYMNTFKTWNNFVEIDNFPLNKWVHVAIVCTNDALEIFINGNLAKKLSFDGFVPYQNYQDLVCFSRRRIIKKISMDINAPPDFNVFRAMTGMLSRLTYFNYALCYAEIQKEMDQGPSSKMDSAILADAPPYLADTWWTDSTKV